MERNLILKGLRMIYFLLSLPPLIIWMIVAGTKYTLDPYNDMGGTYDGKLVSMAISRVPLLIGLAWNAAIFDVIYVKNHLQWPYFVSFVDLCLWGALVNGTVFIGILFFPHYGGKVTQQAHLHWDPVTGELITMAILTVWQFVILVYSIMEVNCIRRRKDRRRSHVDGLEGAHEMDDTVQEPSKG